MSRLGSALGLGLGITAAALAFGSRPLGVAGVGLLIAAGGAGIWASLVRGRVTVHYDVQPMPAAENIAAGQQTVEAAVSAWEHSPHHLENMLGRYDAVGVVVARNAGTGDIPYWAMVLCNTSTPRMTNGPTMFL